ncbi:hypothetical protein XELAEV_18033308mg [Xenopus laevis]|uniref:Uncharacterized protein n=1 Tax=Xenopus laevis TaxID=8355 RepID=A0A974CJ23_XENLA|nr:hypothetical protein XELAEV_18033308mg [Xenopus laevis]
MKVDVTIGLKKSQQAIASSPANKYYKYLNPDHTLCHCRNEDQQNTIKAPYIFNTKRSPLDICEILGIV